MSINIPTDVKKPILGSGLGETRRFLLCISPTELRVIADRMERRRAVVRVGESNTAAIWSSDSDHTEIHFSDNQE